MKLKSVFVRFYKSFNYDYLRKIKVDEVSQKPWEWVDDNFYPYVHVQIDPKITTIVGANESGKSHILTAIEKGMTGESHDARGGEKITRKDFCRYSHFFKSTTGGPRLPDFGFEWVDIGEKLTQIQGLCGLPPGRKFDHFFLFRTNIKDFTIYVPQDESKKHGIAAENDIDKADPLVPIAKNQFDTFKMANLPADLLPQVFRIDSGIALPDSVSIARLITGRYKEGESWQPSGHAMAFLNSEVAPRILTFVNKIQNLTNTPGASPATYSLSAELHGEADTIKSLIAESKPSWRPDELLRKAQEFNLAFDLLVKIAKIDVDDIKLLHEALRNGETGVARSIVDNINDALRVRLNFPRIWAQDRNFALSVEATGHELSFIISDRTGRQYSFDERSSGLRHFLSYYIQYLTHAPKGVSEILLMDEPDAFLSGEAQQDLLKVFQMFADPALGQTERKVPVQVIYVTHSPFLIDKNHAERVRALEKSEGSKGTRVIGGASQNHYEPLRSAFGAFVGETAFISGCNLMVEGQADQILLAGAASYLRKLEVVPETQLLDLNRITIVPAGGSANIPYLVYLARGRDSEKPAVIVLLDSDNEGNIAKRDLGKDGPQPRKRRILDASFVMQLGEISWDELSNIREGETKQPKNSREEETAKMPFTVLEDLVPATLAIRAARELLAVVYDFAEGELAFLSEATIQPLLQKGQSPFLAIQEVLNAKASCHIDKVPFARTVVDLLPVLARERQANTEAVPLSGLDEFEYNMRAVFARLREMQTRAEQDVKDKHMQQKVHDKVQTFLNDHSAGKGATRDEAAFLLTDITNDLDGDDTEKSFIVQTCIRLRSAHDLTENLMEPVREYARFCDALELIRNAKDCAYKMSDPQVPSRKNNPGPPIQDIEDPQNLVETGSDLEPQSPALEPAVSL